MSTPKMNPVGWFSRLALGIIVYFAATSASAQVPVITNMPVARQTVAIGANLTLTVTATGATSYQWKRNGKNISGSTGSTFSGATSAALTITGAAPVLHDGWYQVVVTNASGSVTSSVVFVNVTVNPAQVVAWGYNVSGQDMVPAGLTDVISVTAGTVHTVALKSDGTVAAWGDNGYNETAVPAGLTVAGTANVVAVSASSWSYHTLALKSDGTVVAWGAGTTNTTLNLNYGQSIVPTALTSTGAVGFVPIVSVAAGYVHSVALRSDGTIVAWGAGTTNTGGVNVGQAIVPASLASTAAVGFVPAVAISAGAYHTVAVRADGSVVAWGDNTYGQTTVASLTNIVTVSSGWYHNVALKSDGTVAAWGYNGYGQTTVPSALTVIATANVTSVAAGGYHNVVIKSDGTIVGWGLGDAAHPQYGQATPPTGLTNVVGLAGGSYQTVALRSNTSPFNMAPTITTIPLSRTTVSIGQPLTLSVLTTGSPTPTYQWKHNGRNLSNGNGVSGANASSLIIAASAPYRDNGWYQVTVTNAGGAATSTVNFVNVIVNPAQVLGWGDNGWGQLNVPTGATSAGTISIASGQNHSAALKGDGTVVAWGAGTTNTGTEPNFGQSIVPSALTNSSTANVVAISVGEGEHTLALQSAGIVVAWGKNDNGQTTVPAAAANSVSVAAGGLHSLALKFDGTVVAWGAGTTNTQTGANFGQSIVPTALASTGAVGFVPIVAIAAGDLHSVALKSDGTVVCWGAGTTNAGSNNNYGQSIVPGGLTNVVAIGAGAFFTVALKSDGTVVAWGINTAAAYYPSTVPTSLQNPATANVIALDAGFEHTLALKSDGTITGWGSNTAGQISAAATFTNMVGLAAGSNQSLGLRNAANGPIPVITSQPQTTGVNAGTTNTFSTATDGSGNPTFQWQDNGTDIPGATNASYTTPPQLPQNNDDVYTVEVSNGAGTTTSDPAILWVLPTGYPDQTITFAGPGNQTYGVSPITLTATVAQSSGATAGGASLLLPIFSVVSGPATVSGTNGTTLTITGAGTVVVRASQPGYSNTEWGLYYNAATPVDRTITIAKKALTITAGNATRAYGAANPTFGAGVTGFVNGDTTSVITGAPSITTPAIATSPVTATYAITPALGTLVNTTNNYSFSFVNGVLTITKAPLTVTADPKSRVYGVANPALTVSYSGFANSETPSSLTVQPTATTTATISSVVGTYPITASGGTATNYAFTYVPGTLAVTQASQAAVTITSASTGTFGTAYTGTATGGTGTGALVWALGTGSTAPGAAIDSSTGAVTSSGAGTVVINARRAADTNYLVSATTADFTITLAKAAQGAVAVNSATAGTYGSSYTATATGGNGTGALVWALGTGSTAAGAAINSTSGAATFTSVGTVVFNVHRSADANYNDSATTANFTLTVNKAPLTVTAVDKSRVYATANPTFTASYAGFVNGETSAVVSGAPTLGTAATNTSNVGAYPITVAAGTLAATNYSFGPLNSGTLTITKATPVITWPAPGGLAFGTALSATQLNATADVPGAFVYSPASGTILGLGTQPLNTTFTPTDTTNYNNVATQQTLTVALAPVLARQPVSQTVAPGQNAVFAGGTSGAPAPTGYQWQRLAAGSGTWVNLADGGSYSGTTTTTLLITTAGLVMNGDQFRLVVSNGPVTTTSSPATLTAAIPATWARSVLLMNRTTPTTEVSMGNVDPGWRMAATGDFNGDGKPDIIWQNVLTGQHSLILMNGTTQGATIDLGTTAPTWLIAGTGDFNGDGHPDILWQNIATGQHSIWLMLGTINFGTIELGTTDPVWRMIGTGDFNQDGFTDILWQNIITGQHSVWLMFGTIPFGNIELGTTDPTWLITGTGDFNGDGQTDLLWQNTISGQMSLWLMNGTTVVGAADVGTADPTWQAAGVGDFNGDGKIDILRQRKIDIRNDLNGDGYTDILWQNTVTGQHSIWLMNGTTYLGGVELGTTAPVWQIAGTGDFNGDGQTDILWHNLLTGQHSIWLMHGTTYLGGVDIETTDPVWQIVGTGDFNGDAKTDILFQNITTGQHNLWLMDGATHTGTVDLGTLDPAWQMVGTGDFNGDGFTDILWQNVVTGQHTLWLMTGMINTSSVDLGTTDPAWQMVGTGDFNGDGAIDILWQNTVTGQHSIWLMHGTVNIGNIELGTTDPVWLIVN